MDDGNELALTIDGWKWRRLSDIVEEERTETPEHKLEKRRREAEMEHAFRKGYWHGLLQAIEIIGGGDPRQVEWYTWGPARKWYYGDSYKYEEPPDFEPWKSIRKRILERDGYKCAYCGENATHVDHIVPVCDGGSYEDDNLVAACKNCNALKSSSDWSHKL